MTAQEARSRLSILSPELVEAFEAIIDERVKETLQKLSMDATPQTELLTLEQAGQRLHCSADAVRMRIKRGRLTPRRIGRRVYVSRREVDGLP